MAAQFLLDEGVLDTDLLGPIIIVSANADLGGISSSGSSIVTHLVTMGAELGGLSANANTVPDTPGGDEGATSHGFVQPYFPPVVPTQEIKISTIYAGAVAGLGAVNASAMSEISFSIMEDDAEVLLLI
jgi:hypothetical protein